ncbi:MAG: hypothetical protein A3H72_02125 [Candidatus Doudnabacteria bacterium RIFCSPLOWO2_02_FULL_48_8]|nr:MAG: hypothetical protein A3H72_02125 [Candidatus Doudnabacteria bacterium RIFCSPLOWO2_02_FULL_48_8]
MSERGGGEILNAEAEMKVEVFKKVSRKIKVGDTTNITLTKLVADDSMTDSERESFKLQNRQRLLARGRFGSSQPRHQSAEQIVSEVRVPSESNAPQLNFKNIQAMRKTVKLNCSENRMESYVRPQRCWKEQRRMKWNPKRKGWRDRIVWGCTG